MKQPKTLGLRIPVWFTACLVAAAHAITGIAAQQSEPELLEAEKAFRLSAKWADPASVELRFAIADGYYMYRDRFTFAVDGVSVALDKSRLPKGKLKRDPTFGNVVTYRKSVRLLLPIKMSGDAAEIGSEVAIDLTSQGCADIGVCYPPLRQTIRLARGATTVADPAEATISSFSRQKSAGTIYDLVKKRE